MQETINSVISRVGPGHAGLNLPPLDPLRVDEINLAEKTLKDIQIELNLRNQDVFGLTGLKVTRLAGFNKNPRVLEVDAHIPRLRILGDYKLLGNVLVLPINSQGKSNITVDNLRLELSFLARTVLEKNGLFIAREKSETKCQLKIINFHLDNLFNGSKEMMIFLNDFVNEHWNGQLQQLRDDLCSHVNEIVGRLMDGVFAKVAYSELFLD